MEGHTLSKHGRRFKTSSGNITWQIHPSGSPSHINPHLSHLKFFFFSTQRRDSLSSQDSLTVVKMSNIYAGRPLVGELIIKGAKEDVRWNTEEVGVDGWVKQRTFFLFTFLCVTYVTHGFGLKYVCYVKIWVLNLLLLRVQTALHRCYWVQTLVKSIVLNPMSTSLLLHYSVRLAHLQSERVRYEPFLLEWRQHQQLRHLYSICWLEKLLSTSSLHFYQHRSLVSQRQGDLLRISWSTPKISQVMSSVMHGDL